MFQRNCRSYVGNLTKWEKQQIAWVDSLSNEEILQELKAIMSGHNYSWFSISQGLQSRLDSRNLELEHFEPGNILYEWNVLCDERIYWSRHGRPSFHSFRFNRACLVNLKILPTQAGLGAQGKRIVARNTDVIFSATDLTVEPAEDRTRNEEFKGCDGYFYAEGPEFRIEYIHDRVEE